MSVVVILGAFRAHSDAAFNRWAGWATIDALPFAAIGIVLVLLEKTSRDRKSNPPGGFGARKAAGRSARYAFISYARKDRPQADQLQRELEAAGIQVWRDRSNLWPGEDWHARIRDAITQDALVFLACFSRHSVYRRGGVQSEELYWAIEQLRSRQPGLPWLIPVRFDECRIPALDIGGSTLDRLHSADLFGEDASENMNRLIGVVRQLLGPPRRKARSRPRLRMAIGAVGLLAAAASLTALILANNRAVHVPGDQRPDGLGTKGAVPVRSASPGSSALPGKAPNEIGSYGVPGYIPESVALSPGGKLLAVATTVTQFGSGSVYMWPLGRTAKPVRFHASGSKGVLAVAFSPDGTMLAAADADGNVYVWFPASPSAPPEKLTGPKSQAMQAVAFSQDGTELAAGSSDGATYLWDVSDLAGTPLKLSASGEEGVQGVAFNNNATKLAAADADGITYVWKLARPSAGPDRYADPDGEGVQTVAFNSSGTELAAGDAGGTTYLWKLNTPSKPTSLADPGGSNVESVSFSPSGHLLAAGDADGTTYLWNLAAAGSSPLWLHDRHQTFGVCSVAFSTDDKLLATGDHNGTTYLWQLTGHSSRAS